MKSDNNFLAILAVGTLALVAIPISINIASGRNSDPNVLAAQVKSKIVCPQDTIPNLVCPITSPEPTDATQSGRSWFENIFRRRVVNNNCNWQCGPIPSHMPRPSFSPKPKPTFSPKPIPSLSPCPAAIVCPENCVLDHLQKSNICGCNCDSLIQ